MKDGSPRSTISDRRIVGDESKGRALERKRILTSQVAHDLGDHLGRRHDWRAIKDFGGRHGLRHSTAVAAGPSGIRHRIVSELISRSAVVVLD